MSDSSPVDKLVFDRRFSVFAFVHKRPTEAANYMLSLESQLEAEREKVRVLREKVLQLCDAIENRTDLSPTKWALKCGRLVNEAREMAALQATAPEQEGK